MLWSCDFPRTVQWRVTYTRVFFSRNFSFLCLYVSDQYCARKWLS